MQVRLSSLLMACITLFASPTKAQTLTDGPYVSWLSDEQVLVESICKSKVLNANVTVTAPIKLANPCDGQIVSTIKPAQLPQPDTFTGVSKYMVISDVEGHYEELLTLLRNQKVIDENGEWIFGSAHLVFLGDMVDRGDKVTEVLWFIHRLEADALKAGGRVHFILGNHEKMILEGDVRYVNEKYKGTEALLGREYTDLFAKDSELGRFLRSRNTLIKINDTLFVHAGLSPELVQKDLGISEINRLVRQGLWDSATKKTDSRIEWLLSSKGPLWYRGYFKDSELSVDAIDSVLKIYGAKRVAVGHTIVPKIEFMHEGKVIAVDTSFSDIRKVSALLFEGGRYYQAHIKGSKELISE